MKPLRDAAYLRFVRTFPCCLKGSHEGTVEAHHAFGQFCGGGKGLKGSDYAAVPLCAGHHRTLHSQGPTNIERCMLLYSVARLLSEYASKQPEEINSKVITVTIGSSVAMLASGFGEFLQSATTPFQQWIDIGNSIARDDSLEPSSTLVLRLIDEGLFASLKAIDATEILYRLRCETNVAYVSDRIFNSHWDDMENSHGLDVEDNDWVYCPQSNMVYLRSGLTGDDE